MTNRHRDLRTGFPIWLANGQPALAARPLDRDLRTEVLVVGAGISGALVAGRLSERHEVLVVDRRDGPVRGSTVASTALVEYEIDMPLLKLAEEIGRADAERAWRRSAEALRNLREATSRLGVDASVEHRGSLYLSGTELDADGIAAEAEARNAAGLPVELLSRHALRERFGIARDAALLGRGDFAADPVRLAAGYLRVALARGATILAPVEIARLEVSSSDIAAITRAGPVITADRVVYATGYELPDFIHASGHRIESTYAMATVPQPGFLWPERVMIWEASSPYLYLRTGPGGRAIIGGEDEPFSDDEARDALLLEKIETLRQRLAEMFPHLDTTPDFAWCGSFGASETGLPSIGEVPGWPNVYSLLGFGGNGITFGQLGAELIATAIDGGTDPDADLYAFSAAARRPTGLRR